MLLAFHKPYGVLSQFTADGSANRSLAEFGFPSGVYSLGRLDADSEGLLLLSDEAGLNTRLLSPERAHWRTYWVQVEGIPTSDALKRLANGVIIQGQKTLRAKTKLIQPPQVAPRVPPIRFRKTVPDCWLEIELIEGRNRQVRRMTAAIGHPTLRLIRVRVGKFDLGNLPAGQWKTLSELERTLVFAR